MASATRVTVATFGVLAALAGIEHGIGEMLQGNVAPAGTMILSWQDSALFRVVNGEPAMTVIPNLLVTGILAILASLIFLAWVTMFAQRRHGGVVMILLSAVMLLVGAGFGPPLLGIVLGIAAVRMNNLRPAVGGASQSSGTQRFLGNAWPWVYGAALIAWLMLLPGTILLDHFFGIGDSATAGATLVLALTLAAFVLLAVAIAAAFAHDGRRQAGLRLAAAPSG